jgi:hypothetical protein
LYEKSDDGFFLRLGIDLPISDEKPLRLGEQLSVLSQNIIVQNKTFGFMNVKPAPLALAVVFSERFGKTFFRGASFAGFCF